MAKQSPKQKRGVARSRGAYRLETTSETGSTALRVDLNHLPVPDAVFAASSFRCEPRADGAVFLFGQTVLDRVTAVVGIELSKADVVALRETFGTKFRKTCDDYASGIAAGDIELDLARTKLLSPERIMVKNATLASIEMVNGTGSIAWYQIPGKAVRALLGNLPLRIEDPRPIVEIRSGVLVLRGFIQAVDRIAGDPESAHV